MEHKPLNLDAGAVYSANNASMFDAGDVLAREAHSEYENAFPVFEPMPDWTPEQVEYAERRAEEWRALVEKAYNDLLNRRASWVSVMVAGPANYPAGRMEKRMEAGMKAGGEWAEKMSRFLDNTRAALAATVPVAKQIEQYRLGKCSDPVSADDPAALEKLNARLAFLKEEQEHMKALNAWYRRHKTCVGFEGLSDESAKKADEAIQNAYSWDRQPYAKYLLSNNNANMKRIAERIAALAKARERLETGDAAPEKYEGLTIERNAEANRVQLFFDDKPNEETRALLKSHGFRWSPNAGAWQRQLNANGIYAVRAVIKKLGLPRQDDAQDLTLDEFAARVAE